jgi:hypothetical protein
VGGRGEQGEREAEVDFKDVFENRATLPVVTCTSGHAGSNPVLSACCRVVFRPRHVPTSLRWIRAEPCMQDVTEAAVTATSKGCVWNQNVVALLAKAGLEVARSETRLAGLVQLAEAVPRRGE